MTHTSNDASLAITQPHDAALDLLGLPAGVVLGENGRAALESTGRAALDFFFTVVPNIATERFQDLVQAAWNEDPLVALRLIFNTGNCRKKEGGKMDRHNFQRGLVWLYKFQSETLLANVDEVVRHGSYKILLNTLQYALYCDSNGGNLSLEGAHQAAVRHKKHKVSTVKLALGGAFSSLLTFDESWNRRPSGSHTSSGSAAWPRTRGSGSSSSVSQITWVFLCVSCGHTRRILLCLQ